MLFFSILSTSLLIYVSAENDWSKPCTNGACSYHVKQSNDKGNVEGAMKIWSTNPNAITDITSAAGWSIVDCDSDKVEQDIRVVCAEHASECDHLFNGDTAEDKIVRLPKECGKNAFARISHSWVHDNQTIPDHISKRLVRRDGKLPEVKGLQLDTDFKSINSSKHGDVNFSVTGQNSPNFNYTTAPTDDPNILDPNDTDDSIDNTKSVKYQYGPSGTFGHNRRGDKINIGGIGTKIIGGATSVAGQVTSEAVHDATVVASKVDTAAAQATSAAADLADKFKNGLNDTHKFNPIDKEENFTLTDYEVPSCPGSSNHAKISVFAHAKAHMDGSIWISMSGIVNEGKVGDFSMGAAFNGEFDTLIWLQAQATGHLDTGRHSVFSVGLPGLDFPGILTAGPAFTVDAQAVLDLDISTDLSFGMKYKVNNAAVQFPPKGNQNQPQNGLDQDQQPLHLSNAQTTQGTATVIGYLTPALTVGITAFGQGAEIYLSVDGQVNATVRMDSQKLNGSESTVTGNSSTNGTDTGEDNTDGTGTSDDTTDNTGTSGNSTDTTGAGSDTTDKSSDGNNSTDSNIGNDTMDSGAEVGSGVAERRKDMPSSTSTTASTPRAFSRFFDRNLIRKQAGSQPEASAASSDGQGDTGGNTDTSDSSSASDGEAQPGPTDSAAPPEESDPSTADGGQDPSTTDPTEEPAQSVEPTMDPSQSDGQQSSNSTQARYGGCLDIGASITINAGADASFFNIFNKETHATLWGTDFGYFYQKCFGDPASIEAVKSQDQAVQSREIGYRALESELSHKSLPVIKHKRDVQPANVQNIVCTALDVINQASLIVDTTRPVKHK